MRITDTQRLALRYLTMDDLPRLCKLFSDPRVMQYAATGIRDKNQTIEFLNRNIASYQDGTGLGILGVVHKAHQKLIGVAGCYYQDLEGPLEIELVYELQPNYWGQGLASEAVSAIINHVFNTMGKNRIVAAIHIDNKPSIKLAERMGMKQELRSVYLGMPFYLYAIEKAV